MHKPIVCFGKTRWDVLPTSRQPGGAPFSVAHTNELMYKLVQPISWLAGQAPADCLHFACAAGAWVATHQGATPRSPRPS